jgi:hypothetical protein
MALAAEVPKDRLRAALAASGWEVEAGAHSLPWWAEDVWCIRSLWSPSEARAYVTFLVDPQATTNQIARGPKSIWAVKASRVLPTQWQQAADELLLSLGRGWMDRVEDFVTEISRFRQAQHSN